jgi:hypothetical protein
MDSGVLTAILAFIGSALASFAGIMTSARLTTYRIQQLEKKVEKHNCLVERMVEVEQRSKSNTHRLDEVEEKMERPTYEPQKVRI